jgi:hypothetical protein
VQIRRHPTNHISVVTFHPKGHGPNLGEGLSLLSCYDLIINLDEVHIDINVGIYLGLGQANLAGDSLAFEVVTRVHLVPADRECS